MGRMMSIYLLGLDISTTATKALLINMQGEVVAVASAAYACASPYPLWSEQSPDLWWQGAITSIHAVLQQTGIAPAQIVGLGLTGQMHGLVTLDAQQQVLRPAILWNDQRTAAECDDIRSRIGRENLIATTGNDALTGFTAPKLLWMQKHEPDLYKRIAHVLLPKDFVRLKLTGGFAMDVSDGAGTLLMDVRERTWSAPVLAALEITAGWLPTLFEGTQVTGHITREAAAQTGLLAGTPVVAGAGDQAAQVIGVGAIHEGVVALTLGTSGVVFATTNTPMIEPEARLHAFCHAVPGRWHMMAVMLSAGGSLRWWRDTLAAISPISPPSYDTLMSLAAQAPAGCEGLTFLPYLTGERCPHPDPLARGAFVGLTVRHTLAHMTRALLEGVAFGLRDNFDLLRHAGLGNISQVRISGGGVKSALWRQILADVLDTELVTVNTNEGAAFGAALLAGVGCACWQNLDEACASTMHITGHTLPNATSALHYSQQHQIYQALYPALKAI